MNFLKKLLIPLIILLIAGAVVAILIKTKPSTQQKPPTEPEWVVKAQTVQKGSNSPYISLYAQLISPSEVSLSSNIEASVIERHVETASKVEKNQLLLTLDSFTQLQQRDLRQAEINEIKSLINDEKERYSHNLKALKKEKELLKLANSTVKRASTLEKSAMASSSQLEEARRSVLTQEISIEQRQLNIDSHPIKLNQLKAKLAQARTRLSIAEKDLKDTQLSSPVNGVVKQVKVNKGEYVRKGNELITLIDTDTLEFRALLPKKYIKTLFSSNDIPPKAILKHDNNTVILDFSRIGNFIEKGQAGSYIYLKQPVNTDLELTIGQIYEISLVLQPIKQTIILPHEALYGTDNLFLIKENRLESTSINWLGESIDEFGNENILVSSPHIKNGDVILTSKFANALPGLKVKIAE